MSQESGFAVLNDGNKVAEAERAMLSLKASLSAQGITLDPLVAAHWSLKAVGICRGESGSIRGAEYFNAELVAGARQTVTVEVTHGALWELGERLSAEKTPDGSQQTNAAACEILGEEINTWLSFGGESRWNPVRTMLCGSLTCRSRSKRHRSHRDS